jgi:hypothetical protein
MSKPIWEKIDADETVERLGGWLYKYQPLADDDISSIVFVPDIKKDSFAGFRR